MVQGGKEKKKAVTFNKEVKLYLFNKNWITQKILVSKKCKTGKKNKYKNLGKKETSCF